LLLLRLGQPRAGSILRDSDEFCATRRLANHNSLSRSGTGSCGRSVQLG
jgi:hypothetical protein